MGRNFGWILIVVGAIALVAGVLVTRGWLSWFGRLPGDIRFVSGSTRLYIPITSMILVSLALTVVVNVVRKFW